MKLIDRIIGRKRERFAKNVDQVREALWLTGQSERGIAVDIDLDHYACEVEKAGLSEADVRATVEEIKRRIAAAPLAEKANALREQAEASERALRQADLDEGRRRREALERLESLRDTMTMDIAKADAAEAAKSDLIAGAERTNEEIALCDELSQLNQRIDNLQIALDPNAHILGASGAPADGALWASVQTHPARLAAQTTATLNNKKVGYSEERHGQLKSQLAAAEQAIAERRKELAAAEKERGKINVRLAKLTADKLKPESFRIVRAKPSADHLRKQHAQRIGFGPSVPSTFD